MLYDCFIYILCQTLSIFQYFLQFSFYSVLSWNLAVIKSCTKRVSCRSLGSRNNPLNRSAALHCVRTSISGYYFFDGDSAGEQRLKGRPYAVPWSRYRLREGDVASLPAEYYFLIRFQPLLLSPPPLADHPLTFLALLFSVLFCAYPSLLLIW